MSRGRAGETPPFPSHVRLKKHALEVWQANVLLRRGAGARLILLCPDHEKSIWKKCWHRWIRNAPTADSPSPRIWSRDWILSGWSAPSAGRSSSGVKVVVFHKTIAHTSTTPGATKVRTSNRQGGNHLCTTDASETSSSLTLDGSIIARSSWARRSSFDVVI